MYSHHLLSRKQELKGADLAMMVGVGVKVDAL